MAIGRGGAEGWVFVLASHGFVLPHPRSAHMMGKTFSPHLRPLGPCEAPPHLIKLYFLLICSTTSTIFFFNETYFINKNILEITTKFIQSNQINLYKKN